MAYSIEKKCPQCGALLRINVTDEMCPGGKEREVASCPKCDFDVYSKMTSGFVNTVVITE